MYDKMQKYKFEEIPAGTVIRFPGYKGSFAKAFVCVENDDEDGSYWFSDGKNTVIDCESTPEKVCILKNEYLYVPEPENYTNSKEWCSWIEGNRNKLRELDQKAKKDGKLLGRMVRFQYADGYAVYQISEVQKNKVRLLHVTGLGDDWNYPGVADGDFYDRKLAEEQIRHRDVFDEKFTKRE